ncbi:MAG: TIGR02757 family protein [Candidatus Eisenbacteria bacterium]|nr:TIGR02757 family protein [Candidatus Eisenbacteria bacterium]
MKDSGEGGGASALRAEPGVDKRTLEKLYRKLNRREFVHPDPLEFLYLYDDPDDREVVGLIASTLAYGRVKQILKSVGNALDRMGPHPAAFVRDSSPDSLRRSFEGFKHRFTTGDDLCRMLDGVRRTVDEHGTLGGFFSTLLQPGDETVLPALTSFVGAITDASCEALGVEGACPLPDPERGSACKRLHLFLRWMVRSDDVDPGGWDTVSPSRLVIPLDTHMHRLSLTLGLTDRKQANGRTALEVTSAFREFSPDDPVRYDFALTRLGIRDDLSEEALLFGRKSP